MRALIWVPKSCRKLEPHRISPTQLARSSKHRRRRNIYSSTFFLRHMSRSAVESPEQIPDDDDVYFHVIDGVEEMGRYRPGGYHPVSIGDRLHDRYRVVHKLGYGSYSTAWLARDEQLQRLVAVKVCTADANQRESKILSLLGKSPSRSSNDSFMSGQDVIPLLLDTFRLHGPNGTHTCNVTEFTKGNLAEAKRKSWNMPMPLQVARAMAAQFVLAAAYMHHKGYVHGDLHIGNILVKSPEDLSRLSDEELYQEFGEPEYEPVQTFDDKLIPQNVPTAATLPLDLPIRTYEFSLSDAHILLSDLGESYRPSEEQRLKSRTPVYCRPPEDRFEPSQPQSFPSDVWTLACSVWGIVGMLPLFQSLMPSKDKTVSMQVELLGKLPSEWWARWERRSKYFSEDGQILREDRPLWTWDVYFEDDIQEQRRNLDMEPMSLEEKEALLAMLKPMLKYKPEERCSMSDVLRSKWMTDWAMPEYQKLRKLRKLPSP